MRNLGIVAGAALVSILLFAGAHPAGASPATPLGSLVRSARLATTEVPHGAVPLGRLAASHPVTVEVVLASSDPDGESALAGQLYDPSSPLYHRWLSPAEFATDFGPSSATVAAAEQWLDSRGLRPDRSSGSALEVSGSASAVASAFGTPLEGYRVGSRVGFAPLQSPLVPDGIQARVEGILGLNTLERPEAADAGTLRPAAAPAVSTRAANGEPGSCSAATSAADGTPGGAYTMADESADYGIDDLWADGLEGKGQTIGLFELASYRSGDIETYESCFGLDVPVSAVSVDGGSQLDLSYGGTGEADLDIEQAATQAPESSITVYEAPGTPTSIYDLWNAIVSQDKVQTVSTSWGLCEPDNEPGSIGAIDGLLEQAALQGQSVFAAAGDSGSEDCASDWYDPNGAPVPSYWDSLEVDYPASSPWVTAVGGTDLNGADPLASPSTPTAPDDLMAWNYCFDTTDANPMNCPAGFSAYAAGGGGRSTVESAPSWQAGYLRAQGDSQSGDGTTCGANCREVPDVAMDAGYPIVSYGPGYDEEYPDSSAWGAGYGTSYASPYLAALTADRNQGCATTTGNFGALAYRLAGTSAGYAAAFTDVTAGDNDMTDGHGGQYPAGTGYDLATGLGVPVPAAFACPEITSVTTSDAAPGTTVKVTGLGLEDATIWFGTAPATDVPDTATATSVQVVVPADAGGRSNVTVYGSEGGVSGTITTPFTYATTAGGRVSCAGADSAGSQLPGTVGVAAVDLGGCPGYRLADALGRVAAFGAATTHGDLSGVKLGSPVVAIAATPDGEGYYLVTSAGGVFTYGDAVFHGSLVGTHLPAPVVGVAVNPEGGYWLVTSNGGVFSMGTDFYGSMGGHKLGSPVVGMAVAPGGDGYWLVAASGGVFTFTPYGFHGTAVGDRPARSIVALVPSVDGGGYTLVSGGGVAYVLGDATGYASLPAAPANPVLAVSPAPPADGYYMVNTVGSVFTEGPGTRYFGNA